VEIARRGKLAMTVGSEVFATLGRATALHAGMAGLPIVVVPHPFGTCTREEIRVLAERCADDIAGKMAGGTR
jgi:hypothetical protein